MLKLVPFLAAATLGFVVSIPAITYANDDAINGVRQERHDARSDVKDLQEDRRDVREDRAKLREE